MLQIYAEYPTFTVFLALFLAAAFTLIFTPLWIKVLQRRQIGQQVRADGPESHLVKQGTPTMGGVVMLLAIVVVVILVGSPSPEMILLVVTTMLTGVLGLIDDASKVIKERSLGLTPKAKLVGQFAIVAIFCLCAVNICGIAPTITIPFIYTFDLGVLTTNIAGVSIPWLYLIFVELLIAGFSNAVNLTDGLDGLAGGTVMVVMLVMAAIGFSADVLDASVFAATIVGACIGFLWFNCYPADIFMGDTGSLALSTALGCLAVITKTEVVSLVIGGLFIAEAISVILQVAHYKRTHERLFLMAPLHHHFERKGWSEVKVVIRFWIVSGALAALGFVIYFAEYMLR